MRIRRPVKLNSGRSSALNTDGAETFSWRATVQPSKTQNGGYKVKRKGSILSATEQKQKVDIAYRVMTEALQKNFLISVRPIV